MSYINKIDNAGKNLGNMVPDWLITLAMRISIFMVFWKSVQTKIGGPHIWGQKYAFWNVTDSTLLLFQYEYALPLIPSKLAAYLATFGEFFFSILLLLGLLTRLSALGLVVITLVIQIFVFPGLWPTHLLWAAVLIYLLRSGAGTVSLDRLLNRG